MASPTSSLARRCLRRSASTLRSLSPTSCPATALVRPAALASPLRHQPFHHTAPRPKKAKRSIEVATERSKAAGDDPADFATLHAALADAQTRLRSALAQISAAGPISQASIEGVRVRLKSDGAKDDARLADLAQVVPRSGRMLAILVGADEHIQPIRTAVLAQLGANPGAAPHDARELQVAVPPPTQASRRAAAQQAGGAGERALQAVQAARAVQHKRHRAMELSGRVRPDDVRKAARELEKVIEGAAGEVKRTVEAAKKALER